MGKPTGFLEYNRELPQTILPEKRVENYNEFYLEFTNRQTEKQASRCMDCGTPFCHWGCPLGNIIPEFNDAVYRETWRAAYIILSSTNNFPEFTGRICPAPCESSCVLAINKPAIAIELIEKKIIEFAFREGYIKPQKPAVRTGKKVAIIGSGPSGLAAAAQLNKAGHLVTVFERADRIGGLLRYGIPDFKLEKSVIDRRLAIMQEEGIVFKTNANVGENVKADDLKNEFDAILLSGGSTMARDLKIKGRELNGIHYAMDFLTQQNKRVAGDKIAKKDEITATGKHVVVIGGGDTGSDCVGTSNRHKALSVTQLELLQQPPAERAASNPWPLYANVLRTSSSQEEGCNRHWSVLTKEFIGDEKGNVKAIRVVDIQWIYEKGKSPRFEEIPTTERDVPCDLALLAIGFAHPQHTGMLQQLGVTLDERGNVKTTGYKTSVDKVFAAGDMRRGQSLVVWAISEGREAARELDTYLMGFSTLESKTQSQVTLTSFK